MLRMIAAVITGLITGGIVIALVEGASSMLYPIPESLNVNDRDALGDYTMNMPIGAYIFVLAAWLLGAFGGGVIAVIIGKQHSVAIIVGTILTLGGIANMFMIPHPIWFMIVGILIYIPSAMAGGMLAMKKIQPGQPVLG